MSEADTAPRASARRRLTTLLAVMGPGVLVMVADNDAGSLATFAHGGQDYGVRLVWLLALLAAALFMTQEMAARLGAVTGAGHARLIYERFGVGWGHFALVDLTALNVLTVITEFIGVQLGLGYFGVSRFIAVPAAALALLAMSASGSFRRWEQMMWALVAMSLTALPLLLAAGGHKHSGAVAIGPHSSGSGVLFVVGMVGTTVAPWQLFFQQSNVVDKRITTRWLAYERTDTAVGTAMFFAVAAAVLVACASAFHSTPFYGHFIDGGDVARGLRQEVGSWAGTVFAVALIDGSLLGAGAVSLASSYALGDARGTRHSLHRPWGEARTFYGTYALTVAGAAAAVLVVNGSLGALTLAIQALSGALFPSAALFLLFLANDRDVLGPHVNPRWLNVLAGALLSGLLLLSSVLDLTTAFPHLHARTVTILLVVATAAGGGAFGWHTRRGATARPGPSPLLGVSGEARRRKRHERDAEGEDDPDRRTWTMPPIERLGRAPMSRARRAGLLAMRAYLALTVISVVVRVLRAFGH